MKKRLVSLLAALVLALCVLPAPALADGLPNGWWPVWSAYSDAVGGTDDDALIAAGDKVIRLYTAAPLNVDTANALYMVYYTRMDREVFEKKTDYTAAADNVRNLMDVSGWLTDHGVDRRDMITVCKARLAVLTPASGVYALSYTRSDTYGTRYAPAGGTYYGAVNDGTANTTGTGFSYRSITSFYVELETHSARDFSRLIGARADGTRAILINLNFAGEGDTARAVPGGTYDAGLDATLQYLAGLAGPVLLRIGGEMDVWTNTVTPEDYIAAYRYVAARARSLASNVELVWSPNYVGGFYINQEDFYPGDDVVDWVGLSLYYNDDYTGGDKSWEQYAHKGDYADPILCAEAVISIADRHAKPVIATEGGSRKNVYTGARNMEWTKKVVAKEFSTLNMVYPQVKAIVYFDTTFGGSDYTLTGDLYTAADNAAKNNPALIGAGQTSAGTWVPIGEFDEAASGSVLIGAAGHTVKNTDMKANYWLDGAWAAGAAGSPNYYRLDLDALVYGKHKLEVQLDDGAGFYDRHTYTLDYSSSGSLMITEGWKEDVAKVTTAAVSFNGRSETLNTFLITDAKGGGTNYVLLRDIAALVDGTGSQFDVDWDNTAKQIIIVRGSAYVHRNPSEGQKQFDTDKTYTLLSNKVLVDGSPEKLGGIIVVNDKTGGGNTYFKLRDLGAVCGFDVGWTAAEGVTIKTK